ncbi:MAG: Hpt domain-containing protein [Lachnospiraceae bacterium]|nr:Hpt domain-containing protein [Lachnospiraceae bacterium]
MNEKTERLKALGADTDTGIKRCAGKEDLYLMLVGKALADRNFEKLGASVEAGNKEEAFAAAHALKGILSNLSLTPLAVRVAEVTEKLRGGGLPSPEELSDIENIRTGFIKETGDKQ